MTKTKATGKQVRPRMTKPERAIERARADVAKRQRQLAEAIAALADLEGRPAAKPTKGGARLADKPGPVSSS